MGGAWNPREDPAGSLTMDRPNLEKCAGPGFLVGLVANEARGEAARHPERYLAEVPPSDRGSERSAGGHSGEE